MDPNEPVTLCYPITNPPNPVTLIRLAQIDDTLTEIETVLHTLQVLQETHGTSTLRNAVVQSEDELAQRVQEHTRRVQALARRIQHAGLDKPAQSA